MNRYVDPKRLWRADLPPGNRPEEEWCRILVQPCAYQEEMVAVRGGSKWREVCEKAGWRIEEIPLPDFGAYGLHPHGASYCQQDEMAHPAYILSGREQLPESLIALLLGEAHHFDVARALPST